MVTFVLQKYKMNEFDLFKFLIDAVRSYILFFKVSIFYVF